MKINEIESQLGLTRANVRFYEKEGLLQPARKENGYREYSDEDVATLKKIIIFRKLGLSLQTIHEILEGSITISDAIEQNIETLNQQISELSGALEVCKIIKKDAPTNEAFEEDHYLELIQAKEQVGEKFIDILRDYLELEKKSFLAMWGNVFFLNLSDKVKKYGWRIIFGFLLCICLIRGLVHEFLFDYSSFMEGFLYPLVLSGIIFLITFPIFVIHRKYKNAKPEEETPTRHPVLKSIFKWIGGFAYFVAYLFLTPLIGEILFTYVNDNVIHTATFDFFFLYWIMGLFVLFMFVYLYSKHGLFPDFWADKDGIKARLPKKAKRNVAFVSVAALCLSFFLSMLWYDCFTEDGLTVRRLFFSKSYTWDEIDYYTLSAGWDGTLTYSVIMQDGTKADCIGGGAMITMTNLPEDQYPDSDYDFVRYLSKKFTEQGVELRVHNWEKLYHDLRYESWIDLAEDIREIASSPGIIFEST
ncbi:MAG: MerR family transcriptional regulator [Agathobacter sp.]